MADSDIRRCARLLETMVQHEGISARQIEQTLGLGAGTVQGLFSGRLELELRHVLDLLSLLKVPPARFFRLAFPEEEAEPVEVGEAEITARLLDLLDRLSPKQVPPPQEEVSPEELDRRIAEALRRLDVD